MVVLRTGLGIDDPLLAKDGHGNDDDDDDVNDFENRDEDVKHIRLVEKRNWSLSSGKEDEEPSDSEGEKEDHQGKGKRRTRKRTRSECASEMVAEPILAFFEQGRPPPLSEELGMFLHQGNRKAHNRVLYGQTDKIEYKGKNFGGSDRTSGKACKYLIFRYDAQRKEAVLLNRNIVSQFPYEIRHSVLSQRGTNSKANALKNFDVNMTAPERRMRLIEQFGSRKKLRAVRSIETNKVSEDQVVSSETLQQDLVNRAENTSGSLSVRQSEDETLLETRKSMLPEFSLDTQELDKAYSLENLFPYDLRSAMKGAVVEKVKQAGSLKKLSALHESGEVSAYGLYQLMKVANGEVSGKKEVKEFVRRVQFAEYMLAFHRLHRSIRESGEQLAERLQGAPKPVVEHLLDRFSVRLNASTTIRSKTDQLQQKLALHILVLTLFVDSFKISNTAFEKLRIDLKLTDKKLKQYYRETGCVLSASKTGVVASLRVPLQFPSLPLRRRK